jgi:hypothetical protein
MTFLLASREENDSLINVYALACGGDHVQVMRPLSRKSTQNTRGGDSEDT